MVCLIGVRVPGTGKGMVCFIGVAGTWYWGGYGMLDGCGGYNLLGRVRCA